MNRYRTAVLAVGLFALAQPAIADPSTSECSPGRLPGCAGCECETCVCEKDPYCCEVAWDPVCVESCQAGCGGSTCPTDCVPDCRRSVCGDDGCGGSCGTCPPGTACGFLGRKCLACDCQGLECGDDGCGRSCGSCPEGSTCANGVCVPVGCGPSDSPGCAGCACEPCVCALDPECCSVRWDARCVGACRNLCNGCPCWLREDGRQECGRDFCGMPWGSCGSGRECDLDGMCCTKDCMGRQCGPDGCTGDCGECLAGSICVEGQCVDYADATDAAESALDVAEAVADELETGDACEVLDAPPEVAAEASEDCADISDDTGIPGDDDGAATNDDVSPGGDADVAQADVHGDDGGVPAELGEIPASPDDVRGRSSGGCNASPIIRTAGRGRANDGVGDVGWYLIAAVAGCLVVVGRFRRQPSPTVPGRNRIGPQTGVATRSGTRPSDP